MSKHNIAIAILLSCSLLLTACAESTDSLIQSESSTDTTTASTATAAPTQTAATLSTSTSEDDTVTSTTTTTSAAETTTSAVASSTSEATTATTAATTEITTLTPVATTSSAPVEIYETAESETSTDPTEEAPEVTTTQTEATSASTTPAETPDETVEIVDPEEVRLPVDAVTRLAGYGIDTEKRQEYYTRINKRTDIPVIHISTKDEAEILSIKEYVDCLVDVIGCDEQYVISAEAAEIRVRGNSTAYYGDENQVRHNLVPYRIKFAEKTNMLGLNDGAECKSWVLLKSNWNLIMDYTAFNLADTIFDGEYYYSDCEFVHLYVNEKFIGVYLLVEQNQVNPHRVDINEPANGYKGTDIGYFLEIDNYANPEEKPCFNVNYCGATVTDIQNETRQFEPADYSIDSNVYSDRQIEFISKYVNNVFKIVYEATQNDNYLTLDENMDIVNAYTEFDNAYDTINAVMDLDSVVNMYLLYEICHDYDCGEGSFYMAVDFSPSSDMRRLTFTAPWDFNWAYNDSAARVYYAGAFNHMNFVNQYGDRTNPWFVLFMTQEWFRDMVSEKWEECYDSGKITSTLSGIRSYLEQNADDLNRVDQWGTDNAYKLLDWVTTRCKWLNTVF